MLNEIKGVEILGMVEINFVEKKSFLLLERDCSKLEKIKCKVVYPLENEGKKFSNSLFPTLHQVQNILKQEILWYY